MYTLIAHQAPLFAALLASFFLWCYTVLASVEFGASIFLLFPKLGSRVSVLTFLNPLWEVNNVFLVAFFVSLIAFFPGVMPWVSSVLFVPLCLFLITSGCRILLVLLFFYSTWERFKKNVLARLLLVFFAFAGPALLAWMGIIVLIGVPLTLWPVSFIRFVIPAVVVSIASLLAFAAAGLELFSRHAVSKRFADIGCALYAFSAIWFLKTFPFFSPRIIAESGVFSGTFFWAGFTLLTAFLLILLGRLAHRPLLTFFGLAAVPGILLFFVTLLQRPFLVYPTITDAAAFTAPATAKLLFIVCIGGLVILIPSLVLLYKLFIFSHRSH